MGSMDIANPSEEHTMLREMVRAWTEEHVEPQAFEHDRDEKFNLELLRSMGELGLLGISAPEEYCLLYTSPSPRDGLLSRMPSSA